MPSPSTFVLWVRASALPISSSVGETHPLGSVVRLTVGDLPLPTLPALPTHGATHRVIQTCRRSIRGGTWSSSGRRRRHHHRGRAHRTWLEPGRQGSPGCDSPADSARHNSPRSGSRLVPSHSRGRAMSAHRVPRGTCPSSVRHPTGRHLGAARATHRPLAGVTYRHRHRTTNGLRRGRSSEPFSSRSRPGGHAARGVVAMATGARSTARSGDPTNAATVQIAIALTLATCSLARSAAPRSRSYSSSRAGSAKRRVKGPRRSEPCARRLSSTPTPFVPCGTRRDDGQ